MKRTGIVNIYNFIRMSHQEPSEFLQADYDTIAKQIRTLKQYGLPSTYALKYDALMHPDYQKLMLTTTDENDEIAVWWEISEPLCKKAGVSYKGQSSEVFDERVNSAYSVGYTPQERMKLVDAYMEDFYAVFGYYPKTIGSWILDSVTVSYAQEKYGIIGAAICRDQMGTDGFTLWGGYPNGIYYPSKDNVYLPSQTEEEKIPVATFRLLGPDPVLSFEQDVRKGLSGVYTLEPCCTSGRSEERISWYFSTITQEDGAGIGYAQVGQENSFLWENIRPGFEPQIKHIKELQEKGLLRIETMEESAQWFSGKYQLTPPTCWQASVALTSEMSILDIGEQLDIQWYASRFYRVGFLAEKKHLRIRDWFLYREKYPCRYLKKPIETAASYFDALPVVFAQKWMQEGLRPFVKILEKKQEEWTEPFGKSSFSVPNEFTSCAVLETEQGKYCFTMTETELCLEKSEEMRSGERTTFALHFDKLPVFVKWDEKELVLEYENFRYCLTVEQGTVLFAGADGVRVEAEDGVIRLKMNASLNASETLTATGLFTKEYLENPSALDEWQPRWVKNPSASAEKIPFEPEFSCPESCFDLAAGEKEIKIYAVQEGARVQAVCDTTSLENMIGIEVPEAASLVETPFVLREDARICAVASLQDGKKSESVCNVYRFGWKDAELCANCNFVQRPVFDCSGVDGLLKEERGSVDWQDGKWLATKENLDFTCTLPEKRKISCVEVGFLTNHRSGIIYPEALELYAGEDEEHLELVASKKLPEGPAKAEIAKEDFGFQVNVEARCIRFVAKRYALMPQWCCYKGTPDVFTLADCLIIR